MSNTIIEIIKLDTTPLELNKDQLKLIYSGLEMYYKDELKLKDKPYNKIDQIQELRRIVSDEIRKWN